MRPNRRRRQRVASGEVLWKTDGRPDLRLPRLGVPLALFGDGELGDVFEAFGGDVVPMYITLFWCSVYPCPPSAIEFGVRSCGFWQPVTGIEGTTMIVWQ